MDYFREGGGGGPVCLCSRMCARRPCVYSCLYLLPADSNGQRVRRTGSGRSVLLKTGHTGLGLIFRLELANW